MTQVDKNIVLHEKSIKVLKMLQKGYDMLREAKFNVDHYKMNKDNWHLPFILMNKIEDLEDQVENCIRLTQRIESIYRKQLYLLYGEKLLSSSYIYPALRGSELKEPPFIKYDMNEK